MEKPAPLPLFSPWDLLPLLGALALGLFAANHWAQLPDPIPTHFSAGGRPNGWTSKAAAPWFMFGLPMGTWVFLNLVGRISPKRDAQVQVHPSKAMAPFRGLMALGLFLVTSLTLFIPLYGLWVFGPILGFFFALVIMGIVLMVRSFSGLVPPEVRRSYRWGLFYFNPNDSRVWVEKLIGVGWTLNFAKPMAWVWLVLLLLPVFAALIWGASA